MSDFDFIDFNRVNPEGFISILNDDLLRKHLIDHAYFDMTTIREWMKKKAQINSMPGCRIRAVLIEGDLKGWCGIQPDDSGFEIAIVITKDAWGSGLSIFKEMMCWAKTLGHKEIIFHLLDTRPNYKFIERKAVRVKKTELVGRIFTSYIIAVDRYFFRAL